MARWTSRGPLSFIHSPSGTLHRLGTWGLLTLVQGCIIKWLFLCRRNHWNICHNRAPETHKVKHFKCLNGLTLANEAQVGSSQQIWFVCNYESLRPWTRIVCVHHVSHLTYYWIILMRCVSVCVCVCLCVSLSRGDNPISCLQNPSETPLSHFIHFNPVLGGSLMSHNAADQWFPFSTAVISGFELVLCSYLTVLFLMGGGMEFITEQL